MSENDKQFWVCTKHGGLKDVVWNWQRNMHAGIYPEYIAFDGPYDTRKNAERAAFSHERQAFQK